MRFLATADLHLKTKEDLPLLERIITAAKKQNCQSILIGGDLLDSPFPEPEAENGICTLFAQWGKPVFLVAGNHDPLAVTALYSRLPANVIVFPEGMTAYTLEPDLRLYGCSALREQSKRHPAAELSIPQGETALLLTHGHFEGTDFQPVRPEELAASGLALTILGHIHKGEQRQIGSCRLLIPGIPEGRGWDETGEKFVYIIDAHPKTGIMIEPYSVATRFFREVRVDLTDCKEPDEMLARMEQYIPPENTSIRLILTGTPLGDTQIAARLYTERYGREVLDETDPALSIETLKGQNTLQGAFVRKAMEDIEKASPEERPALEEALRLGLKALKEARL
ncbi:MAG: metallophosphoesterase family protein [Clostridia bacterium]|nr:metallophosphoesterase family protein [Clostridia bacterium]